MAVSRVIDQIADKDVKAAEVVIEKFVHRPCLRVGQPKTTTPPPDVFVTSVWRH